MKNFAPFDKSISYIKIIATTLLILGSLALISLLAKVIGALFIPIVITAGCVGGSWWVLRKLKVTKAVPNRVEAKKAADAILGEGVRVTGKVIRTASAVAKAIREETRLEK